MPVESFVVLTPDGVYRMIPERILTADQYVAMMTTIERPAPVLRLGAGNFITSIACDGRNDTIAIRSYDSIKIPMAVECVRKRIEDTDVETITLAASQCNDDNPIVNPILRAPTGYSFVLFAYMQTDLARLMLYEMEAGAFYALPLANFWDDGRICLGEGYVRNNALKTIDDVAQKVMYNTPNDHLVDLGSSKDRNRKSLFQFTADLQWTQPVGRSITDYCVRNDDKVTRAIHAILQNNPMIIEEGYDA